MDATLGNGPPRAAQLRGQLAIGKGAQELVFGWGPRTAWRVRLEAGDAEFAAANPSCFTAAADPASDLGIGEIAQPAVLLRGPLVSGCAFARGGWRAAGLATALHCWTFIRQASAQASTLTVTSGGIAQPIPLRAPERAQARASAGSWKASTLTSTCVESMN